MIVQIGTGFIGLSGQPPAIRGGSPLSARAASGATPTDSLKRDLQGLASAARFALNLGALRGAAKGATTAQSLIDAAGTGARAIETVVTQLKTLATTAAASGLSDVDRAILDNNFNILRDEITAIVGRTTFGGVKLLDGGGGASRSFKFTVGGSGGAGATTTVVIASATAGGLAAGLDTADLLTQSNAASAKALTTTAEEAATGIVNTLGGQATAIGSGAAVGAVTSASVNSTRNNFLEFQFVSDTSRASSTTISTEAKIDLNAQDGFKVTDLINALAKESASAAAGDGSTKSTPGGTAAGRDSGRPSQGQKVDIRA